MARIVRTVEGQFTYQDVPSSAFRSLTYDDVDEVLNITFTDGSSYVIEGFPEKELDRWLISGSLGGYFNAFVRGNY